MDEKTPQVVETITKIPTSKKVLIGVAAGFIVTGAVALAIKMRRDALMPTAEEVTAELLDN